MVIISCQSVNLLSINVVDIKTIETFSVVWFPNNIVHITMLYFIVNYEFYKQHTAYGYLISM